MQHITPRERRWFEMDLWLLDEWEVDLLQVIESGQATPEWYNTHMRQLLSLERGSKIYIKTINDNSEMPTPTRDWEFRLTRKGKEMLEVYQAEMNKNKKPEHPLVRFISKLFTP